jgi:hypothetical protein
MRSEPGKVPVPSKHISYLVKVVSKPRIAPVRFERGWWQKRSVLLKVLVVVTKPQAVSFFSHHNSRRWAGPLLPDGL